MTHENLAVLFPILDGKELDINVMRAFSWNFCVDDIDGRLIVLIDQSWPRGPEPKLREDCTEVFGMFGCKDGSQELSFRGASSSDGLGFACVGNGTPRQQEDIPTSGPPIAQVIGMSSVNKAGEFTWINLKKWREIRGNRDGIPNELWQADIVDGLLVDDSPVLGLPEILR
jgi:hypothetical protein